MFSPQIQGLQSANNPAFAGRGIPAVKQMWDPFFNAMESAGADRMAMGPGVMQPPQKKVVDAWGGETAYTNGLPTQIPLPKKPNPYGDPSGTGANLNLSLDELRGLYR